MSRILDGKIVAHQISGNSEARAMIDFLPEQEKYRDRRDPFGIYQR